MAMRILKKIDDISFCQLTSSDVVRHPLVQKIVQAYDEFESKKKTSDRRVKPVTGRKAHYDD